MKKYQVYGIGNALVDIEYEVEESVLTTLNIEKNAMTLIDKDQNKTLLAYLDKLEKQPLKASGGSAANTMITLAQFKHPTFYSCKVANDLRGDFYLHDLMKAGVRTNLSDQPRESGTTGNCIVLVTPDAHRSMNTFLGITANFSKQEIINEALIASEYLYIEGYLVASVTGREAMFHAHALAMEHNLKVALTLSDVNMVRFFKEDLLALLHPGVDILFANAMEALLFAETTDLNVAANYLRRFAKQVVITRAEEGALVLAEDQCYSLPAFASEVCDTVGAGDIFAGAFLHGVCQQYPIEHCGILANFAAAQVISQYGPRLSPNQIEQIENFIQETLFNTVN